MTLHVCNQFFTRFYPEQKALCHGPGQWLAGCGLCGGFLGRLYAFTKSGVIVRDCGNTASSSTSKESEAAEVKGKGSTKPSCHIMSFLALKEMAMGKGRECASDQALISCRKSRRRRQ
jgi:hypothetical protein